MALFNKGYVASRSGDHKEAARIYRVFVAAERGRAGPESIPAALAESWLAGELDQAGEHDEAGRLFEHVLAVRINILGSTSEDTAIAAHRLGVHYYSLDRMSEAEKPFMIARAALSGLGAAKREELTEISPAKSLQQAMRMLRTGKRADGSPLPNWQPEWVHPFFWGSLEIIAYADD